MAVVRTLDPETIIGHLNEADQEVVTSPTGRVAVIDGRFTLCDATRVEVLADPDDVPDVLDPLVMRITDIWFDGKLCHALLVAVSETSDTIEVFRLTSDDPDNEENDLVTGVPFKTIHGAYGS